MTDLIYEMGRLITHAAETHQTPTEFILGDDAYSLLRIVTRADTAVLSNQATPDQVFGVAVRRDIRLPRSRIVLKAGQNTVGAISVTQLLDGEPQVENNLARLAASQTRLPPEFDQAILDDVEGLYDD